MPGLLFRPPAGAVDYGNPVAEHPLNRGLVGWWLPLPRWSGGTRLFDLTTKRNHGTLANGPVWASGPFGFGALSFGGTNEYVNLPSGPNLSGDSTVAALVRHTFSGVGIVYGGYDSASPFSGVGLATGINSAGKVDAWVGGGSWAGAGTASNDGLWHLVGFSLAGTGVSLYLDGRPDGTATQTPAVAYTGSKVIASSTASTSFFQGSVGALGVWDRGLSASEWSALYDQVRRGHPDLLRRVRPWNFGAAAGGGGNRRRRVILCGGR